jgi:hypothetical protein
MTHPYEGLDPSAFWRTGVVETAPIELREVYQPKWTLSPEWRIATAGSCFAQHISRQLRAHSYDVIDTEPPPAGLPADQHTRFGYAMYSARTGNIYTMRQLLQLAREVAGSHTPAELAWERDGRFYDALRPAVEPEGLSSPDEVRVHRTHHLARLRQAWTEMDLLIFTLGLTETWVHRDSGTVFPTVPGSIAGHWDPEVYAFHSATFQQVVDDFEALKRVLSEIRIDRPDPHILLTVSPVPLTATASGSHVLQATTESKAILRAAAGQLARADPLVDYFPSYEIITNPAAQSAFYAPNLRSVRPEGVQAVMRVFFQGHQEINPAIPPQETPAPDHKDEDDVPCEEALLEAFSP